MSHLKQLPIILASQSPARLELLKRIKIVPDYIMPAHIDESELPKELPAAVASRLAREKAIAVSTRLDHEAVIISADTVVAKGRSSLPKALTSDDVKYCLRKLSGCRHRLYTGVCVVKKTAQDLVIRQKLVQTILKFKRLTDQEIELYASLGEGINCAGGYAIGGYAESFLEFISGSHSNVIGLPLYETVNMLRSVGVVPKNVKS